MTRDDAGDEQRFEIIRKLHNRHNLGCAALGLMGVIALGTCMGIAKYSSDHRDPKAKAHDYVSVQSQGLEYSVAFECTYEHLNDLSCHRPENIVSVRVGKIDYWYFEYVKSPVNSKDALTPQIQEQAWNMVEGEEYLRTIAEKRVREQK